MQNTWVESTTDTTEKHSSEEKFLTFLTDGELFGIPISDVVQIIGMQEITPLPDFPDYAKGVINLRGNIIPVVDMRIRLKRAPAPYDASTCIIVTSIGETYMGFIVDSVDEVTDISANDISPAPVVSDHISNRYLTGIGQIDKKVVLLLDLSKILTQSEFQQVAEKVEQAASTPETEEADEPSVSAAEQKEVEEKE